MVQVCVVQGGSAEYVPGGPVPVSPVAGSAASMTAVDRSEHRLALLEASPVEQPGASAGAVQRVVTVAPQVGVVEWPGARHRYFRA